MQYLNLALLALPLLAAGQDNINSIVNGAENIASSAASAGIAVGTAAASAGEAAGSSAASLASAYASDGITNASEGLAAATSTSILLTFHHSSV